MTIIIDMASGMEYGNDAGNESPRQLNAGKPDAAAAYQDDPRLQLATVESTYNGRQSPLVPPGLDLRKLFDSAD